MENILETSTAKAILISLCLDRTRFPVIICLVCPMQSWIEVGSGRLMHGSSEWVSGDSDQSRPSR
jgi:hypothetical protein